MCGIFLFLTEDPSLTKKVRVKLDLVTVFNHIFHCPQILHNETIQYYLSRRGPDHFEKKTLVHQFSDSKSVQITMLSSVLQLRGSYVCGQPYVSQSTGSILQWNGQIFNTELPHGFNPALSDTEQLMAELDYCTNDEQLLGLLSKICGPWAFTYWDNRTKSLWFGRDMLGRRSLCWNENK